MALTTSHNDELENKKYRNWFKAGLSLKYLKDGIGDFADECAKLELDRILQKLGLPSRSSCNQCTLTTLRPAHATQSKFKQCPIGQRNCSCLQNDKTSCPNDICGRIYDEIVDSHATRSPNWKSIDIKQWTADPWEIAKCFINAPGYEATRSASDADVAGLLHLFINSKGFQGHMFCTINLFDKIKTWRNSLFHSPTMELKDQQLTDGINDIITFLEDGKELKDKECSKQAIYKLSKLQQDDFIITTETQAEVCRTALAAITQITQELKSMQEESKRDIDIKQKEASNDISLRRDEAVKMVQDTADTLNSRLQKEMAELSDTVKTLELEMESSNKALELEIKCLNERVNKIEQDVENIKTVEDNTTEHLKKMENIIALKRKLKERYRTYYIKTSQSPLKTTENDIDISQVYVTPNMTKVTEITSEKGEKKEHTVQILDYSGIFLTDDKPNKRIYILGDVGTGKSSFCKMMMRNWCLTSQEQYESAEKDVRILEQFDLLFYLPLRTLTEEDSLLEMITWYYVDICTKDDLLNILQHMPERCLVLADGIDEWKPKTVERRREHETHGLPTIDKMDHVTIVMTSRPSAQGILNMKKSNYDVKVRLDGIGKQNVKTLIEKLYPKSHSEDIIRKLRDVPIKDLEKTPMLLQQIIWLQQQNIDIGKSRSEVYSNVVNIALRWNRKHAEKEAFGHTLSAASTFTELSFPDQIKNNYTEFILHSSVIFGLGKMAFEIITQGSQLSFGIIELNENGIDEYLRTKMLGTGLLTEEVRFDNSKENTQFYFTHTSFLEYFAALYIASHIEKDKTLGTDSCNCHRNIFDIIMERCHSVQDVIRLGNVLVIVCGFVPALINNVCLLMYESLKQSHICEQNEILINYYSLQFYTPTIELFVTNEQCRDLAYRCIRECKLSDPQCTLKIPYFAVCLWNMLSTASEKTTEVLQHVDPLTVSCCCFYSKSYHVSDLTVFQNLQILTIQCDDLTNELSTLAEFISQTVTLRCISLIDSMFPMFIYTERDIRASVIYKINLSKHEQLHALVFNLRNIHVDDINTTNLKSCMTNGTKCSIFSTHAEKLIDLEITGIVLKHDELTDWFKLINGSVLLKTIKVSNVTCSEHQEGCSHVLELLHHNQLHTLDFTQRQAFRGVRLLFKNVSTLNLKLCKLDNAAASFSLTDTSNLDQLCLRFFLLKHDELSGLAKFVTRSVSLRKLTLSVIKCLDHKNCSHIIDLSKCTQLEHLEVDRPFSCDKINTSNLTDCNTNIIEVLLCLRDSVNLQTLRLDSLSYSKKVHDCVLTLPKLHKLHLRCMNIEDGVLVMIPEMTCLGEIELDNVNMSESSWFQFLESLLTLNQSVECHISLCDAKSRFLAFLEILFELDPSVEWEALGESPLKIKQYVNNYLSVNKDKFQVLYNSGHIFTFRLIIKTTC